MKLLYRHCKALGYCDSGIETFMEGRGIPYDEFVRNGISIEIAKSWKDIMVDRAIEVAERENNG